MSLQPLRNYRVSAVVYHPKVEQIWAAFGEWFAEQGLPLEVRYASSYDDQVAALLEGNLDTAWNTNLAHVQVLQREPGARALAMRDTDRGWRSHLVTRDDADAASVVELEGARVGFGDADSPQAHILPVYALRREGFDPGAYFDATRLDRDLGKHGDTGGAELAQSVHDVEGVADESPAAGVDAVGEPEQAQVRVGGDVRPVDLHVVARVRDDDELVADDVEHAPCELRPAGAPGEQDDGGRHRGSSGGNRSPSGSPVTLSPACVR